MRFSFSSRFNIYNLGCVEHRETVGRVNAITFSKQLLFSTLLECMNLKVCLHTFYWRVCENNLLGIWRYLFIESSPPPPQAKMALEFCGAVN